MKIKILGTGCPKCIKLEENVREAVNELGKEITIEKIDDINEIMDYGIMVTPGFVINEDVKSAGKLLNKKQIIELIEKEEI